MNAGGSNLVRQLRALLCGALVGPTLVFVYEFVRSAMEFSATGARSIFSAPGKGPTASALDAAYASFFFSLMYACIIIACSVPVWLVLRRLRLAGPLTAIMVGFILTSGVCVFDTYPALNRIGASIPYAICGAIAGLAIWWVDQMPAAGSGQRDETTA